MQKSSECELCRNNTDNPALRDLLTAIASESPDSYHAIIAKMCESAGCIDTHPQF